jgi:hypothetical protein
MGGSTPAAARRAARLDLRFVPVDPALVDAYDEERARLGRPPRPRLVSRRSEYTYVADDPDAYWEILGPHALHEIRTYHRWLTEAGMPAGAFGAVATVADVRRAGTFQVMTPDECVDSLRARPETDPVVFHPLVGGLSPTRAWESVRRFETDVAPRLPS